MTREPNSSIDDRLGLDHERLDVLFENLRRSLEAREPGAGEVLMAFETALFRHMEWEEKLLFPAVAARCSARSRKSLESLEIDHDLIRERLSDVHRGLTEGNGPGALESLSAVATLLKGHNYDEEHGVYVEADRLLSPGERRLLLESFDRASGART